MVENYEDIRSDIKLLKHNHDALRDDIKELIVAIKENTKENHSFSLTLKDINARIDVVDSSCKRSHERMDKVDSMKNALIMGILSAISMAVLGLVMKTGVH